MSSAAAAAAKCNIISWTFFSRSHSIVFVSRAEPPLTKVYISFFVLFIAFHFSVDMVISVNQLKLREWNAAMANGNGSVEQWRRQTQYDTIYVWPFVVGISPWVVVIIVIMGGTLSTFDFIFRSFFCSLSTSNGYHGTRCPCAMWECARVCWRRQKIATITRSFKSIVSILHENGGNAMVSYVYPSIRSLFTLRPKVEWSCKRWNDK